MRNTLRILIAVMLLSVVMLLTGCNGERVEIEVGTRGDGVITIMGGYTKEILNSLEDNPTKALSDSEDIISFTIGDAEYYGRGLRGSFGNPREMLSCIDVYDGISNDVLYQEGVDVSLRISGKGFIFDIDFADALASTVKDGYFTDAEKTFMPDGHPEAMGGLLNGRTNVQYVIKFPYDVTQVVGKTGGVDIDGHVLTLNFRDILNSIDCAYDHLTFTVGETKYAPDPVYMDVMPSAWYYNAVQRLYEGDMIHGYGDGKFGPNDYLTAAQLAELICNARGVETGDNGTGYWAALAVQECVSHGYIEDRGPITSENYDVTITREEAVSGLAQAAKEAKVIRPSTGSVFALGYSIPDYNDISLKYRLNIVDAYFAGVTQGVDGDHTFNPHGILTRAEMCQLFYNLDWTFAPSALW